MSNVTTPETGTLPTIEQRFQSISAHERYQLAYAAGVNYDILTYVDLSNDAQALRILNTDLWKRGKPILDDSSAQVIADELPAPKNSEDTWKQAFMTDVSTRYRLCLASGWRTAMSAGLENNPVVCKSQYETALTNNKGRGTRLPESIKEEVDIDAIIKSIPEDDLKPKHLLALLMMGSSDENITMLSALGITDSIAVGLRDSNPLQAANNIMTELGRRNKELDSAKIEALVREKFAKKEVPSTS